jgi:hypothetical protein
MSDQIIKVLEYLGDKLGIAIDWTTENVLPYAEQLFHRYVTLKIVKNGIGVFIGVVLVITAIAFTISMVKGYMKTSKNHKDNIWYEYSEYWKEVRSTDVIVLGVSVVVICVIASIPILGHNASSLIEWIIIPEIPFAKEVAALLGTAI